MELVFLSDEVFFKKMEKLQESGWLLDVERSLSVGSCWCLEEGSWLGGGEARLL
jgi:hypothetical protein